MGLDRQVYCYSVGTDAFYNEQESAIHQKMLKLYQLRKILKDDKSKRKTESLGLKVDYSFWLKSVNKLIAEDKETLSDLLDKNIHAIAPRQLQADKLTDKSVISLFESTLTRNLGIETGQLTEEIFVVTVFFFQVFESIVKHGFTYNGEKYVFLTASAGQIRKKMAVFIKESSYERIKPTLMCGLTFDIINAKGGINPNKFLAYLALNNSATEVWEDFDIDKAIVVDDFETMVKGEVDYVDDLTYEVTRKMTETAIPHLDGCGMMLDKPTRMFRAPWCKGLLVYFPFDKFIQEKCGGECVVTDIYGVDHKIIAEGIRYILTKSQLKLAKFYDNFDQYKAYFKQYHCEACYCNIEEQQIPTAKINYQMLQTLSDITDREIDRIIAPTVKQIEEVGNQYQVTMKLLGAVINKNNLSYFQQALLIYPELFKDVSSREILKQTKKSLIKQAKGGRLKVNGKYLFLSPDLYAFCEWLFLGIQEPQGLLQDGEVYTTEYANGDELACLRSPHLYREWCIEKNVRNEELDKWFGDTKCLYTSTHSLISKVLQFDKQSMSNLLETVGYKTV